MASPITGLDHLRVDVADLQTELANYEILLGSAPLWQGLFGGQPSAMFKTQNVALWLLQSEQARGLAGLGFRVDSKDRMRRRLQRAGMNVKADAFAHPLHAAEDLGTSGGVDRLEPVQARGLDLCFVERASATATKVDTQSASAPISGLDHVVIGSCNAESTAFLLAAQLGLDMRMDLSNPDWGARLLFFRCGDLIVEVFERLPDSPEDAPAAADNSRGDHFYGLTWRTPDAAAQVERLKAAGFDISEARKGRRPGSRVTTVRDRTAGVATLLIDLPQV